MQAYRDGIAKFTATGAKVFTISTDNLPSQRYWVTEVLKTSVPMLSDFMRGVSEKYGVLNKDRGYANRATFVVGTDGRITYIEEGNTAIDPSATLDACSRPKLSR